MLPLMFQTTTNSWVHFTLPSYYSGRCPRVLSNSLYTPISLSTTSRVGACYRAIGTSYTFAYIPSTCPLIVYIILSMPSPLSELYRIHGTSMTYQIVLSTILLSAVTDLASRCVYMSSWLALYGSEPQSRRRTFSHAAKSKQVFPTRVSYILPIASVTS